MKQTQIEKVIAELETERAIVEKMCERIGEPHPALTLESAMLAECIARLRAVTGNGTVAPKPTRTRKGKKAETGL